MSADSPGYRPRLCGWCGRLAITDPAAKSCSDCKTIEKNSTNIPGPEHELTGYRQYVDHRGITRWERDEDEAVPVESGQDACASCPAKPWEPCIDAAGKSTRPHARRIIRRECRCGNALPYSRAEHCPRCNTEVRRQNQAESQGSAA